MASRLKKFDIIIRRKIKIGRFFYWFLGKEGAILVGGELMKKVSLMTLEHNDYVAELAIDYLLKNPESELRTEYELKQELYGFEAKNTKIPDLVLNGKIAIEVELSRKNERRLSSIISNYLRSQFIEIVYYTHTKGIADRIYKLTNYNPIFKFKIFKNNSILTAEDYYPNIVTINEQPRNSVTGVFESDVKERLRKLRDE